MIHQLFVSEESAMRRCQMACAKRVAVLVSGSDTRDGSFRVYRGLVKSVEDFPETQQAPAPRWRITLQD